MVGPCPGFALAYQAALRPVGPWARGAGIGRLGSLGAAADLEGTAQGRHLAVRQAVDTVDSVPADSSFVLPTLT